MPTLPELNGLTTDTNSVTTGYMNSHEPGGADSPKDRPPGERIDEIIRSVSDLVRRAINIERQAGKQEEWYYRLHGQLKVVEDSVRALNDCRRRMEAQQSDLSPFIRLKAGRELSTTNPMRSGGSNKNAWPSMHGTRIADILCSGRWD